MGLCWGGLTGLRKAWSCSKTRTDPVVHIRPDRLQLQMQSHTQLVGQQSPVLVLSPAAAEATIATSVQTGDRKAGSMLGLSTVSIRRHIISRFSM